MRTPADEGIAAAKLDVAIERNAQTAITEIRDCFTAEARDIDSQAALVDEVVDRWLAKMHLEDSDDPMDRQPRGQSHFLNLISDSGVAPKGHYGS